MQTRLEKWDKRYLELAKFVAQWSKDSSTKTGAVIVSPENFVVGMGYNGFPRRVKDTEERLNNRNVKYQLVVHCERNAIISAQRNLQGCTLYTWPFTCCAPCAGMVIQAGIKRCVAPCLPENLKSRWEESIKLTQQLFDEAEVGLISYPEEDANIV